MKKNAFCENDLQKMYLIRAIRSGMFSISVIVLFFKSCGLTMKEILFLQSLFAIAVLIFEVPTGYFADRYGRRESIIVGGIFSALGYAVYSISSTFSGFLAGEVILAFGYCFVSGADSAIIYEHTGEEHGKNGSIKTEGNGNCLGMISEAVTSVIGGSLLALVSFRFPLYFDALLALAVVPVAFAIKDRKKPEVQNREVGIAKMFRVMKYSLHDHKEVKWLIVYSAVVSTSTLTMVWFIQVYWEVAKIPMFMFGVIWALLMCVGALVARKAHAIEEKLGRTKSLTLLIAMPVLGYVLLSSHVAIWTTAFIFLFYVARGMNNPIIKCYINNLVPSQDRSTILSVQSLMGRVMFSALGPIVGWIHDLYSLQVAMLSCAGIFSVLGIGTLLMLHRHKVL